MLPPASFLPSGEKTSELSVNWAGILPRLARFGRSRNVASVFALPVRMASVKPSGARTAGWSNTSGVIGNVSTTLPEAASHNRAVPSPPRTRMRWPSAVIRMRPHPPGIVRVRRVSPVAGSMRRMAPRFVSTAMTLPSAARLKPMDSSGCRSEARASTLPLSGTQQRSSNPASIVTSLPSGRQAPRTTAL